ncbi:hypothetical protein ACFLT9_04700 [Acidobacteriota bacterium]
MFSINRRLDFISKLRSLYLTGGLILCLLQPAGGGIDFTFSDLSKLNEKDKAQLTEVLRLKSTFGAQIWPDIENTKIPLILYNESFMFLTGLPNPPAAWSKVISDLFEGKNYYRKPAEDTQAFAVPVGQFWAGSLDTLELMNRSMDQQIRENIPAEKLTPALAKMFEVTPAFHVTVLLHESFHAYQAMTSPERFKAAQKLYSVEESYPYENPSFSEAWNREGVLLLSAWRARDLTETVNLIEAFLESRQRRRDEGGLDPDLVKFERELEWLEGLGKYAEMHFAELAYQITDDPRSKEYRVVFTRARYDLLSRLAKAGEQSGDLRFYLSGVVQAYLLDRVAPGWKRKIQRNQALALEDLLRSVVIKQ